MIAICKLFFKCVQAGNQCSINFGVQTIGICVSNKLNKLVMLGITCNYN